MSRDDLYSIAVHEAAHAVASVVLHVHLVSLTTMPDDERGTLGGAKVRHCASVRAGTAPEWRFRRHIRVVLAGEIASAKLAGRDPDFSHAIQSSDAQHAAEYALAAGLDPAEAMREEMPRARALVEAHWPAILRVAEAVIDAGWLSGRAVRALVRQASANGQQG